MGAILVSCRNRGPVLQPYLEALASGGWKGRISLLRPDDPPQPPVAVLAECAGLLLTGGQDIHPRHWDPDEPLHPTAEVDGGRDALELPLVRAAWAARIPLLGICRGAQVLNVALGGSLVQDIADHFGCPAERHQHGSAGEPGELHQVTLAPGSRLAAMLGPGPVPVNTRHHQAVRRLASSLRASAWDPATSDGDGPMVEGIEAEDPARWAVGVQWHPENLVDRDDPAGAAARALFAGFLRSVRSRTGGPVIIEG